MFPHERSLVELHKDKPFALLGVNVDDEVKELKKIIESDKLNWRNWFDGSGGPIYTNYQIEGLPAILLLDHQGVIRYRFGEVKSRELDRAIDSLLKEAPASKPVGER